MKFSKLTIGSGSTMEQIVEGEFEIQAIEYGDNKTVPMFVGVRGKRSFGSLPARTRESLIAIPVGGVSIAEIMVEEERPDEPLDVPEDIDTIPPGQEWLSHLHGGMVHEHFLPADRHEHDHTPVNLDVSLGEAAP